jgi:hypothetical protein
MKRDPGGNRSCSITMIPLLEQLLEIAVALMILAAFAFVQFRGLDRHGMVYLAFNLGGSAILTVLAGVHQQWGFLLLQGVWAVVSFWGLAGLFRRRGGTA